MKHVFFSYKYRAEHNRALCTERSTTDYNMFKKTLARSTHQPQLWARVRTSFRLSVRLPYTPFRPKGYGGNRKLYRWHTGASDLSRDAQVMINFCNVIEVKDSLALTQRANQTKTTFLPTSTYEFALLLLPFIQYFSMFKKRTLLFYYFFLLNNLL